MSKKTKEKAKGRTKDEKFDFDEEIIIGLKKIDVKEDKPKTKKNKNQTRNYQQLKQDKSETKPSLRHNNFKKKSTSKKKIQKKLTPQQEMARKKRRVIFRITKWIMFLAIIIGAAIYALLSPIFNIKNISVVGNSKISVDEIISLSEIQLEQNMFGYHKKNIIQNIKGNAYIDTVKVKRKIPDVIELVVTERKPRFMLQIANAYAYISTQGYILEISNQRLELPILVGFETKQEDIQEGYRLCTEDLEKLGDALEIMESASSNKLAKLIVKIDIKDSNNYILTLQQNKKTVYLGDTSNLSTKMLWILKFNEIEGNTQGEIILNMNLNDERNKPYFRKKV